MSSKLLLEVVESVSCFSVAYLVWTGSAIALVAVMGMVYFKEPSSELKIISITLISFGVIGLALGHKAYN